LIFPLSCGKYATRRRAIGTWLEFRPALIMINKASEVHAIERAGIVDIADGINIPVLPAKTAIGWRGKTFQVVDAI
jgi:hypothetical protein